MNFDELTRGVHPSWRSLVDRHRDLLEGILAELDRRRSHGEAIAPHRPDILRVLHTDRAAVRVLIVGQDPYPTAGHAMGLSFSTQPDVRPLPRSLSNIFREMSDDLGIEAPASGDLTGWSEQGVMLLNRVLTVTVGVAGSHRGIGWERFTEAIVRSLMGRNAPLVAILWGRDAESLRPQLDRAQIISSAHPSPLSARRGFLGSRPFSRATELLQKSGVDPLDWSRTSTQGASRL